MYALGARLVVPGRFERYLDPQALDLRPVWCWHVGPVTLAEALVAALERERTLREALRAIGDEWSATPEAALARAALAEAPAVKRENLAQVLADLDAARLAADEVAARQADLRARLERYLETRTEVLDGLRALAEGAKAFGVDVLLPAGREVLLAVLSAKLAQRHETRG